MKAILKFSTLLLTIGMLAGCSKKGRSTEPTGVEIPQPKPQLHDGQEVTNLAGLYVSTENEHGANSAQGSSKLTDGSFDTKFLTEHTPGFFLQMSFPQPTLVGAYEMTSGDDFSVRDPRNWTVTASNDSINWVLLDNRAMEDFQQRKMTKRYGFVNGTAYRHYRWNISATHWDHYLQMSDLRLYHILPASQAQSPATKIDTFQHNNLTLAFIDNTPGGMNAQQQQGLKDVFFTNYPLLRADFNPAAPAIITFKIAADYSGAAFANAARGFVYYGVGHMSAHLSDIDVATHELMHIIQNYPSGPGWVTEGIADYVRHVYGLNNAAAGWALSAPVAATHYTKGYGDAARFFLWLEKHGHAGLVKKLNTAMRTATYTAQFWANETGKNVDQLWADYISNPAI